MLDSCSAYKLYKKNNILELETDKSGNLSVSVIYATAVLDIFNNLNAFNKLISAKQYID